MHADRCFRFLSALTLLGGCVAAESQSPTTAWINGRWFDGTSFVARTVYTQAGRLTLKPPAAIDRTVDLRQGYVTPAFAEAHNHNIPSPDTAATLRKYLSQGIFYVMIQENQPGIRERLAGQINTADSVDVAFANGAFTAPGGHPSALVARNIANGGMTEADRDGGFLLPVATVADIEKRWAERVRVQKPDFVKMMLVYSEDRAARRPRPANDRHGLDPDKLPRKIVQLAHRDGLRVSAHVESAHDFAVAVATGADLIAHMPGFWPDPPRIKQHGLEIYRISDEFARRAGRRNVTVVTTLGESLRLIADTSGAAEKRLPGTARMRQPLLDLYRHNLSVLARNGVRLAIGSDSFRGTSVDEALAIHDAKLMSPAALLQSLSSDGAAAIFPKRAPFGVEGAPADFLVLDQDPLADFRAITNIRMRVKSGRELEVRR
jgi:imidazolonepropionase-like amidohydrolase